jgi:3-oxoacyl-[acyl-carrier protein] reductase
MDLELTGNVALVAGASRGLGAAIATRLAQEGCRVVVTARGEEQLRETARELEERTGAEVHAVAADVTDPGAAQLLVGAATERFGRLDLLVGNAGGNRRKPFAETTDEDWADILNLNFQAHLRLARASIPAMREAGGGAMLFVASIFGREAGGPELSIYNATKSALISAAKIMALELAGEGIRVNTLAPGSIRFPGGSWDRRVREQPEQMKQFVADNIPLGRFGTAEEVGDVAAFLLSKRASLITGACLNADGGQSRSLI